MTNVETCRKVSPAWSRPVRLEGDPFLKIVAETQTGSLSSTLMLLEFPWAKRLIPALIRVRRKGQWAAEANIKP